MKNCINRNTKEFKQLLEATKLPSIVLEVKISKWQEDTGSDEFPTEEEIMSSGEVNYSLKAIEILDSEKAIKTFEKGNKANWDLNKILTELQIPKEQKALLLDLNITDREELVLQLASNYSYTVKIDTSNMSSESYQVYNELSEYENTSEQDRLNYHGNNRNFEKPPKEFAVIEESTGKSVAYFDTEEEAKVDAIRRSKEVSKISSNFYNNLTVPGGTNYIENEISTPHITPSIKGHAQFSTDNGIGWFRSDEVLGEAINSQPTKFDDGSSIWEKIEGIWYQTIKGDEQSSKRDDLEEDDILAIYYDRYLDKTYKTDRIDTKTRRILEVQSDLFQKGRDKDKLVNKDSKYFDGKTEVVEGLTPEKGYWFVDDNGLPITFIGKNDNTENKFLQLLNKDSNWVTFFVKSIIQDSVKKDYEKVLFPAGDTASKIEGHTTLEEFKKQKQDRIKQLEEINSNFNKERIDYNRITLFYSDDVSDETILKELQEQNNKEINQLKEELERVEGPEGFGALKPIYDFYETRVQNVLNKQYGKDNVNRITDEYNNDWFEITLNEERDQSPIFARKLEEISSDNIESMFNEDIVQTEVGQSSFEASNQILFNNQIGNNFTVNDILSNIASNVKGITVEGLELIEKAKALVDKSGAKIKFVSEASLLPDSIMEWSSTTNTIKISRARLYQYPVKENVKTFLHEVAHSTSGKALLNPQTFEEKEFKVLVEKHFEAYSGTSTSYGFTNPMEFVAELYSNKDFRDEVRTISETKKDGFWNELLNAIRRLFGLRKSVNFDNLIETIVNNVESDQTNFKGIDRGLFARELDNEFKPPTFVKLEDRLAYLVRKAKDNMDQVYNRTKKSKKTISKTEKKDYIKNITSLIDEMASYNDLESWKVVLAYTKSFSKTVNALEISLSKKDLGLPGLVDMIYNYEDYLGAYDLLDEIKSTLSSASIKKTSLTEDNKSDIDAIKNVIRGFESKHSEIKELFIEAKKEQSIAILSNPKYNTKVETDFRKKLQQEYKDKNITGESMNEYVSRMMNTRDKLKIQNALLDSAEEIANNPTFDITAMSKTLFDPLNTNSRLIEIVTSIINTVRDTIITDFNNKDFQIGKLFKSFIKESGNKKPSSLYSNMYEKDSNGNYFLKGEYKIEFRDKYIAEYIPLQKTLDSIIEKYTDEGLSKSQMRKESDYNEAFDARKKWLSENTITDPSDALGLTWIPAEKYKNTSLTGIEKKVLDEFKNITLDSNKKTNGKNSLIRRIKNNGKGIEFYRLPSMTKSDFERTLELDTKGLVKDKITDLTTIKPDDIGFSREAVNNKGEELRHVRVHYRGNIDTNQQSLDLFTMYRLEYLNGLNYSEKTKEENNLLLLKDISRNKQYIKKSARTGKALVNVFSNREATVLTEGQFSNEFARIEGLLESNLYDIMNKHAGTILGADVNKLVRSVNGISASIAMSLNLASGTANVFNGMTQLFIESMGSQFVSKKSLLKAELAYGKDLPNILADLSNPTKVSRTNQILQMFDSFGGFSPAEQEFIRNTMVKKLGSKKSLNGFNEMGEHMMQSILTMAVLDNLKVMNKQNKFINTKGEVVEESKAASYLDMLKTDENGQLYMDKNVAYSSQNLGIDYFEGGKTHVNLLIKKKIHDLFGVYDPNMQNELYKTFYGKMLMMFKRFLISGLQSRYKGIGTANKAQDELSETDKIYNSALKEYEEGYYTTLVRFFSQGIIPMFKNLSLSYTKDYYNTLTEYERGNLRKVTTELAFTAVLLPALAMLLTAAAGDDDDDLAFWLYEFRRLESELSQFRNPIEATRLIQNPVAGSRLIQNSLGFIYEVLTPVNFIPESDENTFSYLDEDSKGKNILWKKTKKIIPIASQLDKDYVQMHNFIDKN